MRQILCWLPKNRLFRSVVLLSGTTLLVQVVGIGLAPVYSRLYTPVDYGVFGQFYSIVSTLLTVGCFCFELAIPTVQEQNDALALVALSIACLCLLTLASFGWALWGLLHATKTSGLYILFVPVGVLLSGLYRIAQYWSIRLHAFKAVAGTSVKQMVTGQAVNLGFGLLRPTPLGLILAQIINWSAGVGSLARATSLYELLRAQRASSFAPSRLWRVAVKHRQYALTQCPSTLLNSLGFYLPGMLMLPYYQADFAGQFNMAQRIGRIPLSLVSSSLSQVFFSEAATLSRTDPTKLRSLFDSVSRKLALSSFLVLFPCLLAPFVVPVVFGTRWHGAGELTMWLGFGLAFQMCVSPLSNIPNVVGRLKGQLVIDLSRAVFVFAAMYIPYKCGLSGKTSVICYSAVLVINYIVCYLLYRHQVSSCCLKTTSIQDTNPVVSEPSAITG